MEPDPGRDRYTAGSRADRGGGREDTPADPAQAWACGGGWGKRAECQYMIQLVFQQHLILRHCLHKSCDAFVDRQYVLGTGTGAGARQCSQDILQFLTLSVEDMAQGKLFHRDGCDNHGQSFLPGHIRPAVGKRRHRHIQKLHNAPRRGRDEDVRQGIRAAILSYDSGGGLVPAEHPGGYAHRVIPGTAAAESAPPLPPCRMRFESALYKSKGDSRFVSLPGFPKVDSPVERVDAVNQILSSIAMQELGRSRILNAEGEKL